MKGKPDGFETVRKMGNDLEKSGQFLYDSEYGKWSGKIQKVVTLSEKWEMICKFQTVYQVFLLYAQKNSGQTKENPGSNVTLLPQKNSIFQMMKTNGLL